MNLLLQWLASETWATLVKALLHTLWIGGAAAGALYLVLRRKADPASRYRWCTGALLAVVLGGIVIWAVLQVRPTAVYESKPSPAPISPIAPKISEPFTAAPTEAQPEIPQWRWTPWLALVWLGGMAAMLARAGSLVAAAEKLRRKSRALENEAVLNLIQEARHKLGLARRVRVVVTEQLTSPAVMGVLTPVLILPLSMVTTLPMEQLRLILLHELAHIRRGDYLVNLCQLLAESLLFFNPAIWWISRQIRQEREACCDAMAIALAGGRLEYAKTLAEVAGSALTAAPAFSDERNPSGLKDRIQRLLVPGYRPALRLTWCALLAAVFVGGGLLILSAVGAQFTVAAILSPQQRIDRIAEKMTELGERPVAVNMSSNGQPASSVNVSGRIRAAGGSPVPEWISLSINSYVPRSSTGVGEMAHHGVFSGTVPAGTIFVGLEAKGFAPISLGPMEGTVTNSFTNLEIVLQRGYDVRLQLVDAADGAPLPNAQISTLFTSRASGYVSHSWLTGADGFATLTHCADLPMNVSVNLPGYAITMQHFDHVRENEPLRVDLRRGETVSGVVLDKTAGKPIAGAELHLLYQSGGVDTQAFAWDDALHYLGRTDSRGAFALNQLARNGSYYIGVTAVGHESVRLENVVPGQSNPVARLGPELVVRGRIVGGEEWLRQQKYPDRALYHSETDRYENNSYGHGDYATIRTEAGVTHFQFTIRAAGSVNLAASGKTFEREVNAPVNDWAIDLSPTARGASKPAPEHEVIFRFTHFGTVPPRGTVSVLVPDWTQEGHQSIARNVDMAITNGEVHVKIPIGGTIAISPSRMVGYWFTKWTKLDNGNLYSIPVSDGPSPMIVEIPVLPAGAIYAEARNADGAPAGGLLFGITELKRAPGRTADTPFDNDGDNLSDDAPRRKIFGALPLEGTYQIYGWRGNSFCVSQSIKLTEAKPDAEAVMRFPPGKILSGVVLVNPSDQPLRGAGLSVEFILGGEHSFGLKSVFTDENGRFQIEDTTPDCGEYTVNVNAPGMMAELVKIKSGSTPTTIRLKRGRTLAGRVLEAGSKRAVPNVNVNAFEADSHGLPMVKTKTDADGRFAFTTLGDVDYHLGVEGAEMHFDETYRPDGRTNLVLPVKFYAWSKPFKDNP